MNENYAYNYQDKSINIGGNVSNSQFNIDSNINEGAKQNLAEAASEIQQILEQLSKQYPTSTTVEKTLVVAKAMDVIESQPTLKNKAINALQAGGKEAFKEAINHPLVNILMSMVDAWNTH